MTNNQDSNKTNEALLKRVSFVNLSENKEISSVQRININSTENENNTFSQPTATNQVPYEKQRKSPFITARKLFEKECDEIPSLIEPIFPKVGIVSVVGSSDTGKSTFLRQLAFSIAYGESAFLGFPIHAKYNRAIYVSTEDDEASINKLLKIQFGIPDNLEKTERLKYIFETENILKNITVEITENPVDLIVIDAFADLYPGDINANNIVRRFLNKYRELALKHNCLIIFLHHTGKRTENLIPSKNNSIGSQGFEAKMRLMIELRKDPMFKQIRHLCIVKGNYLPEAQKSNSIVTNFNQNMLFENLNCSVPFKDLAHITNDNKIHAKIRASQLKEKGLSISEIKENLNTEGFDFARSTIGTWVK